MIFSFVEGPAGGENFGKITFFSFVEGPAGGKKLKKSGCSVF